MLRQIFMLADKTPCKKLCFCFEMKILPFSGILSLSLSLSLSLVHPVLTSTVYCFFGFYLFRYSLITIHSVKKNSTRTAVGVSDGMHPCFITYDARQMRHWWGLLQTTLCFPVTAQPGWFMCIPLGQRKAFLQFYTSFHLTCNSVIYSGMWENM